MQRRSHRARADCRSYARAARLRPQTHEAYRASERDCCIGGSDTPGDSLPLAFRAGRQQSSADCAPWLARAKGLEGSSVASGALPRTIAHRSTCEDGRDGSIYAPSAFSWTDGYEADSVPEATTLARSASIDA